MAPHILQDDYARVAEMKQQVHEELTLHLHDWSRPISLPKSDCLPLNDMVSTLSIRDMDDAEWEKIIVTLDDVDWNNVVIDPENQSFSTPLGQVQFVMDRFGDIWLPGLQLARMLGFTHSSEGILASQKRYSRWGTQTLKQLKDVGARIPFYSGDNAHIQYVDEKMIAGCIRQAQCEGGAEYEEWILNTLGPTMRRHHPPPSRPEWRTL